MFEEKAIKYPKETGDVLDLVEKLLEDITSGKSLVDIAQENLPELYEAVEGVSDVKTELEEDKGAVIAAVGYHVGKIAGVLLNK